MTPFQVKRITWFAPFQRTTLVWFPYHNWGIRRSKGNTLVDHKKIKNTKSLKRHKKIKKKGKIKQIEVIFAHLIKGCRPLWRTRGVLIPSVCVKTTPEPFTLKVRRPHIFQFFLTFSSNKHSWRLPVPSSLGRRTREPSRHSLAEG